jgi:lipoprotein-releasing system permease protein
MINTFEWALGWRYTRAKRRNSFISFIALTAMLGIALGVAALIVVISVMNGFQTELRSRILAATAHVVVRGAEGTVDNWPRLMQQLQANKQVQVVAPYIEGEALFTAGSQSRPGLIRAVEPVSEGQVAEMAKHMKKGSLTDLVAGEFKILLGRDLGMALGVNVGDKVSLTVAQGTPTPAGTIPRGKSFTVAGFFEIGYEQIDSRVAMVHLADAQKLYQYGDAVSGLRVRLNDLMKAPQVAREWLNNLPPGLYVADWTRQHASFFRAIEIEKRVMFIILTLIVAVAAFNLVSTLVMVVTDKQADIAILRTLGARASSILKIFILQGAIIGITGTLLGAIGGIALAANLDTVVPFIERLFGVVFIDKSVYQISDLPSEVRQADVISIISTSLILSLLATLYPSWQASRTQPAEALRYE